MNDILALSERIQIYPLPPAVDIDSVSGPPEIHLTDWLIEQLDAHASASMNCEIGGLLVGTPRVDDGRLTIEVTGSVPAEQTDAGPAHLRFTHESWRLLRIRRLREHPDAMVVGWYHSHPGWGVFLSSHDRALHEQVFSAQPWAVALVLDPVRGERGFFWSSNGQFERRAIRTSSQAPQRTDGPGGDEHGLPDAHG